MAGAVPIFRAAAKANQRRAVAFVDMHLSHLPQSVLFGFFGKIDFAVIEATEITADGRVYLTTSIGASPTFLQTADKVIIEINRRQSPRISEMADIIIPEPPPYRMSLDLDHPLQRIGKTYAQVDPGKVVGVVETDEPDEIGEFCPATILQSHRRARRQVFDQRTGQRTHAAGVSALAKRRRQRGQRRSGRHWRKPDIPNFFMYSEVLQPPRSN